ncbi:type II toxin-antitoxin system antitoxin, RelB/DinJ family, partial [Streptococcus mutans]|nr:type II toxin-antitoxin system antitoxin, RelB/DinJ family [Streptococcus mutans]
EIKDSSADDLLNKRLTDLIMENAETVKTIDLDNSD